MKKKSLYEEKTSWIFTVTKSQEKTF
jgi:hypothetical protein